MSGPELANYIKENYDMTQGGPISDDIKNRLTFEEHEDDLTVPMLENATFITTVQTTSAVGGPSITSTASISNTNET